MSFIIPWSEPIQWAQPKSEETIYLVIRHGEVYGNDASNEAEYSMTGSGVDWPLLPKGHEQAALIANKIAALQLDGNLKIDAIYSSPLTRAVQTAEYFAEALNLPLEKRDDLREIYWGDADGKLVKFKNDQWGDQEKQITQQFPDRKTRWDHLPAIPNAEKYNALLARVTPELKKIGEVSKAKIVLIVTHGRVIKTLTSDALNKEEKEIPYPQNCGIAVFRSAPGMPLEFIEIRENK